MLLHFPILQQLQQVNFSSYSKVKVGAGSLNINNQSSPTVRVSGYSIWRPMTMYVGDEMLIWEDNASPVAFCATAVLPVFTLKLCCCFQVTDGLRQTNTSSHWN